MITAQDILNDLYENPIKLSEEDNEIISRYAERIRNNFSNNLNYLSLLCAIHSYSIVLPLQNRFNKPNHPLAKLADELGDEVDDYIHYNMEVVNND